MIPDFKSIKAVGFDLDKTLYAETPEMEEIVHNAVVLKILEMRPEYGNLQNTRKIFLAKYQEVKSWSKILLDIGIQNPTEVLMRCLATAHIEDLIQRDEVLINIIEALYKKYFLFIITGSTKMLSFAKLQKIGINPNLFKLSFFGDDERFTSKLEPNNFKYFLSKSQYAPSEHVYVGDNIQTDIIIPKNLGMKTILVGRQSPDADCSIFSIHDIGPLLL